MFNTQQDVQSLYIHWPFCPYKCHFCPFVALAGHDAFMERYHAALCKELESFGRKRASVPLKTIFFGGGTPSTYPPALLKDIFAVLNTFYTFDPKIEVSLEVNPGTVTAEKLAVWKEVGINRLSIGVQSLNDTVLQKLNRHQRARDVYELLDEAPKLFTNLSVDLIIGLPGVSAEEWKKLVNEIITWPIMHVSLYFLTVHEDTPLYFGVKTKKIELPQDDVIVDLYLWTRERFAVTGLDQYEISNFARTGYQSQHNTVYWQRKPYKGLGLGACSFDGLIRSQNEKNLIRYLECLEQERDATIFYEELSEKQAWLEVLMLGLRQSKGVLLKEILKSLSPAEREAFFKAAAELKNAQLLTYDTEHAFLTPSGLAVSNEVTVKLSCI
jgi:oxygen-independent coproporphyrinogen III oxidase